ncbi:MAG: hypothetical protein SFY67_17200 [Candidatus Melainabacteria bacterium]|nr:hypothetical protein [Candidatus Melainabacteria bacterium]
MRTNFLLPILVLFCAPQSAIAKVASDEEVKTLSATEFSRYAIKLYRKINLIGPTKITSLADREGLLSSLYRLKTDKLIQLEDKKLEKNAKAIAKNQSEIDLLDRELKKFPYLHYKKVDGYVEPSPQGLVLKSAETFHPVLKPSNAKYRVVPSFKDECPLLYAGREVDRPFKSGLAFTSRINFNTLSREKVDPLFYDSLDVVREQIRIKHGKYYVGNYEH